MKSNAAEMSIDQSTANSCYSEAWATAVCSAVGSPPGHRAEAEAEATKVAHTASTSWGPWQLSSAPPSFSADPLASAEQLPVTVSKPVTVAKPGKDEHRNLPADGTGRCTRKCAAVGRKVCRSARGLSPRRNFDIRWPPEEHASDGAGCHPASCGTCEVTGEGSSHGRVHEGGVASDLIGHVREEGPDTALRSAQWDTRIHRRCC